MGQNFSFVAGLEHTKCYQTATFVVKVLKVPNSAWPRPFQKTLEVRGLVQVFSTKIFSGPARVTSIHGPSTIATFPLKHTFNSQQTHTHTH